MPDNITGLVTPAKVREVIDNLLDTIKPSYGSLATTGTMIQVINITPSLLQFGAIETMDAPEWSGTTTSITRSSSVGELVATSFQLEGDALLPANTTLTFTIMKDGVATEGQLKISSIKNDDQDISFSLFSYNHSTGPCTYTVQVESNANARSVTFGNCFLIAMNEVRR